MEKISRLPGSREDLDPNILALGIRQPWGELILSGKKTLEIRTMPTRTQGLIYLYAGKTLASEDFVQEVVDRHQLELPKLPTRGLIGAVEIVNCRLAEPVDEARSCVPWEVMQGKYAWELKHPQRFSRIIPVTFLPYGVWFYPFKRK